MQAARAAEGKKSLLHKQNSDNPANGKDAYAGILLFRFSQATHVPPVFPLDAYV